MLKYFDLEKDQRRVLLSTLTVTDISFKLEVSMQHFSWTEDLKIAFVFRNALWLTPTTLEKSLSAHQILNFTFWNWGPI